MRIVIDTSGLLSLSAGGVLELATQSFDFIISTRVKEELNGISKDNDFEANLAKNALSYINREIKVIDSYKIFEQAKILWNHL